MIRKKHYITGRGTRYFKYNSGIVQDNRSIFITGFLPFLILLGLVGAGSYYGYRYYQNSDPLAFASQTLENQNKIADNEDNSFEFESLRAKEDEALSGQIKSAIDDMPSETKWSVSVRDLNSGRMANVNADEKSDPAGLFKLFMLPGLDKRLSSDYWDSFISYGHSVNECVTIMIKSDDDACVSSFGYYVGWDTYNDYNKQLSFINTSLGADGKPISTSREVSEMMYRLQNSQIMSDKARRVAFDAFYSQDNPHGVKTVCGESCLVGSMISEREDYKHEVAVVTNNGAKYIVTIFSKGASWDQIANLESMINTEMSP